MKIPGARLPVYSSPQSSWSMQEVQGEHLSQVMPPSKTGYEMQHCKLELSAMNV